ncbi:MAG: lysine--tRNA ligase [Deltaproteobacteria bacterium]|nr:lysine--tRNA ligase [Deltaproteobacteria bacterium]
MASADESNRLIQNRRTNLEAVRAAGGAAYPNRFVVTSTTAAIRERFGDTPAEDLAKVGEQFRLAGRIMALRAHGKTAFADLHDRTGRIQLFVRKDQLEGAGTETLSHLDLGDLVGAEGGVLRTRTGELSVEVTNIVLLAKSLRPLPEKWHGLKDVETRFRERAVDLLVNPGVREIFVKRARIIQFIREFLSSRGFLEVETPMMQALPGGATARPFRTHHNALGMDLYLRIAPELYLKRLVVGGLDRVFEINRNFRNEGLSTRHNPEFTMLEFYQAYATHEDLMALTEEMLSECAREILGSAQIEYQGQPIDLSPPWGRLSLRDAITRHTGIAGDALADRGSALEAARALGVKLKDDDSLGRILAKVVDALVEPHLVQPTFVVDYPTEVSPLSRPRDDDPSLVERFEAFIGALEVANGFSELNDPDEQRRRFLSQLDNRDPDDPDVDMDIREIDEDYIRTLEVGMPPTAGEGIGIDRLVMLLTNSHSIREVILFPQLRPEHGRGVAGEGGEPPSSESA